MTCLPMIQFWHCLNMHGWYKLDTYNNQYNQVSPQYMYTKMRFVVCGGFAHEGIGFFAASFAIPHLQHHIYIPSNQDNNYTPFSPIFTTHHLSVIKWHVCLLFVTCPLCLKGVSVCLFICLSHSSYLRHSWLDHLRIWFADACYGRFQQECCSRSKVQHQIYRVNMFPFFKNKKIRC